MRRPGLAFLMSCTVLLMAAAAPQAGDYDPMRSAWWADMQRELLGDGPVKYDYQVRLIIPRTVEDAFSVPLVVELSDRIQPAEEVVIVAENNPIQTAARLFPRRTLRSVGMNVRLERTTPVRAAARDAQGVWHVASVRVEVQNPGGCTAAGGGSAEKPLGTIAMKRYRRPHRTTRLKVRITHPMDTGLVADAQGEVIPAYFVETVALGDTSGPIADLVTSAALSANPNFYFDLPDRLQTVRVTASDSRGLTFNLLEPSRPGSDERG